MAIDIVVPTLGESITEATVLGWRKAPGDAVTKDEILVELETDKVTVEVTAETDGVLLEIAAPDGEDVAVGSVIGRLDSAPAGAPAKAAPEAPAAETPPALEPAKAPEPAPAPPPPPAAETPTPAKAPTPEPEPEPEPATPAPEPATPPPPPPAAAPAPAPTGGSPDLLPEPVTVRRSGAGGTITAQDLAEFLGGGDAPSPVSAPAPVAPVTAAPTPAAPASAASTDGAPQPHPAGGERLRRVPMSRIRRSIAARLKEAQQTAAMLTTFNEVDMGRIMELRRTTGADFEARHGVRLGLMSFFVKACVSALRAFPAVNAEIDGDDIVYKDFYDIGIAVGGGRGLVVPVLRGADAMGFADIERAIADFGARAQAGSLKPEELEGGTFTISNGGVYGSMLSTPILNAPQSGILGLHRIQDRPVAESGAVVIRPMMYLALSYDHRIVDGREAVSFLVRVRETLEQPGQFALDI